MANIIINKTAFLDAPITVDSLHGMTFTNENGAHQFVISAMQGGNPLALTGSVSARFMRANNTTILLTGSVTNGKAVITLHQDCYNVPGRFQLAIFNTVSGTTTCIYAAIGTVQRTVAGDLIDSGEAVPDISELLAQIDACEQATAAANAAATKAVRYDTAQTLTDAQKAQARENIDGASVGDVNDLKSATDALGDKVQDGVYPFAVTDNEGKAALLVDESGYTHFKAKYYNADKNGLNLTDGAGNSRINLNSAGMLDFAVCDANGNLLFYVDNGKLVAKSADIGQITNGALTRMEMQEIQAKRKKPAVFDAEINMFIAYGQSWSVGYDTQAISTTPRYDNIMFNTGIKNNPLSDMSQTQTSFVPMVEQTGANAIHQTMVCGETPVSAMCSMVKQLIEEENGYSYTDFPYQMLGNAPGYGDKTLTELAKGTDYYNRLVAQVQAAYNIASSLGKRLIVRAFTWQQLEKGTASGTYAENLEQLRSDIDTDVKMITGQTQDVKCITWQTFNRSATGAAACYDKYVGASETYANIVCSGPSYQFRHVASGNLHLVATDNDWAGGYFGVAYKRTFVDGEKFIPLKPIKAAISGNKCLLTFNVPSKPIVFDTITVMEAVNMGFTLLTSDGTEKTITGVKIVAPDAIEITASDTINTTDRIAYGQNAGTNFGPVDGNRGNVRDSQGDLIKCTVGDGKVFDLHNWLVIFDKTIETLLEV